MINPYELMKNLRGLSEVPGPDDNYFILWCLSLCGIPKQLMRDETAWCSASMNGFMKLSGKKGTGSARARSWLLWGVPVDVKDIQEGDVLVFSRGELPQPGADVQDAQGHVGFYTGNRTDITIEVLAGNQGDKIGTGSEPISRLLGIRREA